MANGSNGNGNASDGDLLTHAVRQELERGLRFSHVMEAANRDQGNEGLASAHALVKLLVEKGILTYEEFEAKLEQTRKEIGEMPLPRVRLGEAPDKYADPEAVDIDCAERLPLCRARCCSFRFFLSKQDLREGVALWDYGNPYWIKQRDDGYCVHIDPASFACTIHTRRPHICRTYDCRSDQRIWKDFEQRIPAPPEEPTAPEQRQAPGMMPIGMAELVLHDELHIGNAETLQDPA